jgi:hypothetical protein
MTFAVLPAGEKTQPGIGNARRSPTGHASDKRTGTGNARFFPT